MTRSLPSVTSTLFCRMSASKPVLRSSPPDSGIERPAPQGGLSKRPGCSTAGSTPAAASISTSSSKVSTASTVPCTYGSRISAFLAMHGPMNTIRTPSPRRERIARAAAIIGETTGARASCRAGRYFSTYDTMAGQGVLITGLSPRTARRTSAAYSALISSAPKAVSQTSANPIFRSAVTARAGSTGAKATGKEGARQATTVPPPSSILCTSIVESSIRLAFCVQTFTHWPQAMHCSSITVAWPAITFIAFAGHSRTQV